jgi:hypothetical protein
MSQGAACRFGNSCHFVHLASPKNLSEEDKAKLDEFVNDHPQLTYAEPKPGTTQT